MDNLLRSTTGTFGFTTNSPARFRRSGLGRAALTVAAFVATCSLHILAEHVGACATKWCMPTRRLAVDQRTTPKRNCAAGDLLRRQTAAAWCVLRTTQWSCAIVDGYRDYSVQSHIHDLSAVAVAVCWNMTMVLRRTVSCTGARRSAGISFGSLGAPDSKASLNCILHCGGGSAT